MTFFFIKLIYIKYQWDEEYSSQLHYFIFINKNRSSDFRCIFIFVLPRQRMKTQTGTIRTLR